MSKPTDRPIIEEMFTGEILEPEPPEEPVTFAEGQQRLGRALEAVAELLKPHLNFEPEDSVDEDTPTPLPSVPDCP